MYNDSGINSSCGWWPFLQGGDTPTHAIIYSKHEKKSEIKPDKKRILSAKQRLWLFDPLHESFLFSQEMMSRWKQMLLLLHAALVIACRMSCCHCIFIIQLGMCEVWFSLAWHNIPKHSLPSDQKNNPCSAWLKLKLGTSQPPTPTPIQQWKRPHPKFWRRHQMVVVFVWLILFLSLSFNVPNACLALNIQVVLL